MALDLNKDVLMVKDNLLHKAVYCDGNIEESQVRIFRAWPDYPPFEFLQYGKPMYIVEINLGEFIILKPEEFDKRFAVVINYQDTGNFFSED